MKIYKNPFVSRPYYFVVTGAASSGRAEARKSTGYAVEFWDGKWIVNKVCFYNNDLGKTVPVVAKTNVSIQAVINKAILSSVLDAVCEADKEVASVKKCIWLSDDFDQRCTNADCPMCTDWCPVPDTPGVCKFEERREEYDGGRCTESDTPQV